MKSYVFCLYLWVIKNFLRNFGVVLRKESDYEN
jgi:hypothetical protein